MTAPLARAATYGRMIKLSHSVFALPFALAAAVLAAHGAPSPRKVLWILVAMVGARSAAMGFNRLADHELDARNPRTAGRELPTGRLTRREVWAFVSLSAAVLVAAAAMLNPLCLALSPVALLIVFGYSYTKRFTAFSHAFLGLSLAIAPVGAWLAVRSTLAWPPVVLGLAVLLWVAGFDTIYACQDAAHDRAVGLRSLPAGWGIGRALVAARAFHAGSVVLLAALYAIVPLHPIYLAGVAAVAGLLAFEHSLVHADDLSRVDAAFFAVNGWISIGYFACTLAATLLG